MEGYFVLEDNAAYAWVMDSKNRLEKREVTLGDYDSELCEYEVLSGLTADDYIAWPMPSFENGLSCTTDMSQATYTEDNTSDGAITDDGSMIDDGSMTDDGAMTDDGSMTDDGAMIDDGAMTDDGAMIDDGINVDGGADDTVSN